MTLRNRAEPPTVLSVQIEKAIEDYVHQPAGPTLADHVANELMNWLGSWPYSSTRTGSEGPKPVLFMPGDDKGSHVSSKQQEHKADPARPGVGAIQSTSRRYFKFTWPNEAIIYLTGSNIPIGKIEKGMMLFADEIGRWEVDFLLDVYYPMFFWMDISGFRESGGWPLFHELIPRMSYAATGTGIGYPLTFTGTDPNIAANIAQVSFCTRIGQGQFA